MIKLRLLKMTLMIIKKLCDTWCTMSMTCSSYKPSIIKLRYKIFEETISCLIILYQLSNLAVVAKILYVFYFFGIAIHKWPNISHCGS